MKTLVFLALTVMVIAKPQGPGYNAPASPALNNRGPDASNFQYNVPVRDARTYSNADVNVERFPGGVNYQVNENGQGSDVRISVETSAAGHPYQRPASY